MTSYREKRCRHCGVRFRWQSSGPGSLNPSNSDRYCPRCWEAVSLTLRKLPVRVKQEWEPVQNVTVEMCLAWEKEWEAEWNHPWLPFGRRIVPPLYDMKDTSNVNYIGIVEGRGEFLGRLYRFSTWSKKPENNTVKVAMELTFDTGERVHWRDL